MYENFPYSNFHDLNTDWIVKKIKDVETSEANAKASEENAKASELASAESADQAHASELNAEASALASAQSATASANSATEANNYVTNTRNQVNLLQSRVDNIIPSGTQTEGNTELLDIRVGYNGVTYSSAGDAVRGQISEIGEYSKNLIQQMLPYTLALSGNNTVIYRNSEAQGTILVFPCTQNESYTFHSDGDINRNTLAFYQTLPSTREATSNYQTLTYVNKTATFTAPITGYGLLYAENVLDNTLLTNSQIEKGTVATPYIKYGIIANDALARYEIENIQTDIDNILPYVNKKIELNNIGASVIYATGNIQTNLGIEYRCSEKITIQDYYKRIKLTVAGNNTIANIAFYDSSDTYIQALSKRHSALQTIDIDLAESEYQNASYFIVSSCLWSTYGDQYTGTVYGTDNYEYENTNNINVVENILRNPKGYKKMLTIGDSLTNASGDGKHWQDVVVNSFGLSEYIREGATGLTVATVSQTSIYDAVQALTTVEDVNLITFWGGTNDWSYAVQLGDFDTQLNTDTRNTQTFYGAVIGCIEKLLELYPSGRIVMIGTTPRVFDIDTGSTYHNHANSAGLYLEDYVNAVKRVAEWFGIPFLDLLHCGGINELNINQYMFEQTPNGQTTPRYYLHFNGNGMVYIGNRISAFIRSIG